METNPNGVVAKIIQLAGGRFTGFGISVDQRRSAV
jgi:hypothetical protein